MSAFPFDIGFQRAIVRLAMQDETFAVQAYRFVDASYFTTKPLGWIWTSCLRYWQEYGIRCTELPLRDALRYVPAQDVPGYSQEIDAISLITFVAEGDYIRAKLEDFIKRSIFAQVHKRAQLLYNDGKPEEAYDETQRGLDSIRNISFANEKRSFFFEEIEMRLKRRRIENTKGFSSRFGTGIQKLDDVCDGGAAPGEVWLVQGYAKAGKSTWLIDKGFRIVRVHREPVLHIQAEGSLEQTEARYDARFTGELYNDVRKGDITPAHYKDILDDYRALRGLLVIRAIDDDDWDPTILRIDAEYKILRSKGFVPKGLIVDYIDLFRSRHKNVDSETQHQIDATRDLKRFTERHKLVTHTVSQTQRPKDDSFDEYKHIIKTARIAEAYGKIRIVDFLGSLNATRAERDANISRFFAEMHRDQPVGWVFELKNDIAHMRIAIESRQIEWTENESKPKGRKKKGAKEDDATSGSSP